jgi:hypothetical protein
MSHLLLSIPVAIVWSMIFCNVPAASFENTGIETVARRAQAELGPDFRAQIGNGQRVVLLCSRCEGLRMITIQISRQTDGTEGRVRTGQTKIADLESQCQASEPSCKIERADMGPAVGWLARYRGATGSGYTLVLLNNGNMLTVRSNAATAVTALEDLRRMQRAVIPEIIGR